MLQVGVDTGGTFTDFAFRWKGSLEVFKVPSTPSDPAQAVLAGLARIRERTDEPIALVLGTTVATNALLTGRGARAGLVTTAGFEDLLEIGRQARPELYALDGAKPPPIIPRPLRMGVPERVGARGEVIVALRPRAVQHLVARLKRAGVESVAVGTLHSYANDVHEKQLAEALARLEVPVTRSAELSPLPRELERLVLAATNARVTPLVRKHLAPLEESLDALRQPQRVRLMMCDGGAISSRAGQSQTVRTILSGPAGGLTAAAAWWRRLKQGSRGRIDGLATLDVGGTSADCGYVSRRAILTTEAHIGPYPFALPTLEVTSVGAGGGSIARLDAGGALRVGPESAGAEPGPACYGRGSEPTVTDAFVVLDQLSPDWFLGGEMKLHPERAQRTLSRLGRRAGVEAKELARGIVRLATTEMARGIRRVTLQRGKDTRRLALFAFGGAGGLFAAHLMTELDFPLAVVPPAPGALSAFGALMAPITAGEVRSIAEPMARWPVARRRKIFDALERQVRRRLRAEGAPSSRVRIRRSLDLCYRGQSYFLEVADPLREGAAERAFVGLHRERYGVAHGDHPLELAAIWVRGEVPGPVRSLPHPVGSSSRNRRNGRVLRRHQLAPGWTGRGPILVVEATGTTVVPRGFEAELDPSSCLVLRRRERT